MLSFSRSVSVNGVRIRIPSILGIRGAVTEPWMIDILSVLVRLKVGAFLDVGVNVGQTLIKLRSVDPTTPYIGFEPNPACVFYVEELIRANGFGNCTIVPVGLFTSDELRPLNFFTDSPVGSSPSVIDGHRSGDLILSTRLVPLFRFASIEHLFSIDRVGIVKIDVEGAEPEVVECLAALICRSRPFILLEVLSGAADTGGGKERQERLGRFFQDNEYSVFRVGKTVGSHFAGLSAVAGFGSDSQVDVSDYVAVPQELVDAVRDGGLISDRSAPRQTEPVAGP